MNIDGGCSNCHKEKENINDLFKSCDLTYNIWFTIKLIALSPNNTNSGIIDWIEHI